jgi:hypothetical protein
MKERIAITIGLLSLSLMLIAMATPVHAGTTGARWVEPAYYGEDPSLDHDVVVGYLENTNWNYSFSWLNSYGYPVNISAVRMYFDWGKNYTYSFSPINQIMPGATQTFTLYNATPPITEAPELWTHYYEARIDFVNNTVAPYQVIGSYQVAYGYNFAVLSANHRECLILWHKLDNVNWYYPMSELPAATSTAIYGPTEITKVYILFEKAYMEFQYGEAILEAGVFGEAKTHLTNADTMYGQALDTWDERGTAMEDADLNNTIAQTNMYNAEADATRKTGDAALVNAYGTLLFGLGWVFIGLGAVIYGMKKPKAAPPPT